MGSTEIELLLWRALLRGIFNSQLQQFHRIVCAEAAAERRSKLSGEKRRLSHTYKAAHAENNFLYELVGSPDIARRCTVLTVLCVHLCVSLCEFLF